MKVKPNNNILLKIILFWTYVSWSLTSVLITSGDKLNFSDFFKKVPIFQKDKKTNDFSDENFENGNWRFQIRNLIFQMKISKMEPASSNFCIEFFRYLFLKSSFFSKEIIKTMIFQMQISKMKPKSSNFFIWFFR